MRRNRWRTELGGGGLAMGLALSLCTWASACVDGKGEPEIGGASITPGQPLLGVEATGSSQQGIVQAGAQAQDPQSPGLLVPGAMQQTNPAPGAAGTAGVAGMSGSVTGNAMAGAAATQTPQQTQTEAGTGPQAGAAPPTAGTSASAGTGGTMDEGTAMAGTGATDEPVVETPPETPVGPSEGMLTIRFTTVTYGGRYGPRNIGAVWIEDANSQFVRTLKRWAGIRAGDLFQWNAVSGGWGLAGFFGGGGGGSSADEMDAISAATLRSHESHTVPWDMRDLDGNIVPDGTYRVAIEISEDSRGPWSAVEFQKGPMAQSLSPPDEAPYTGLTIEYQP